MTKETIENYLYNFDYYEEAVRKLNLEIEELKERKAEEYEKYPQLSFDRIRTSGKHTSSDPTMEAVIRIMDKHDRKIQKIEKYKQDKYREFFMVREAVGKLRGEEQGLIRAKYFESKRGEKLYQACFLLKRGYFSAQKRMLDRIISLLKT